MAHVTLKAEVPHVSPGDVLEFFGCTLHCGGEFGGNIDVSVRGPAEALRQARQRLRIALADGRRVAPIAHGREGDGEGFVFDGEMLADDPPTEIELWWSEPERRLGPLACQVAREEDPEPAHVVAPETSPASGSAPPLRLLQSVRGPGVEHGRVLMWRTLGVVLATVAAVLGGGLGAANSEVLAPLLAVALMGALLMLAIPTRYLHFDRRERSIYLDWAWRVPPLASWRRRGRRLRLDASSWLDVTKTLSAPASQRHMDTGARWRYGVCLVTADTREDLFTFSSADRAHAAARQLSRHLMIPGGEKRHESGIQ